MASRSGSALDRALGELARATPSEFVLVRSRLERELKDAGEAEAAAELRRRRRPHLAAWAVNQLAHGDPDVLSELLEVTGDVAASQAAALRGERDGAQLREVARRRQDALARAADAAVAALAGVAPDPNGYRDAITATLDAASVDADAARELRGGLLTKPMRAPAGLGLDAPAAPAGSRKKSSSQERARARRAAEQARKACEDLETAAEEADAEVASAEMQVHSARVHLDDIQAALARAKEQAQAADEELIAARERARDARRAAAEAGERARQADAQLSALED